jgi:hypothetical protein
MARPAAFSGKNKEQFPCAQEASEVRNISWIFIKRGTEMSFSKRKVFLQELHAAGREVDDSWPSCVVRPDCLYGSFLP